MNKFQILAITVAALLMAPLAMSWANYLAPVLALVGVCVAGGVVIHWALNTTHADHPPVKFANGTVPAMVMPQLGVGRAPGFPAVPHPTHDVYPHPHAAPVRHNWLVEKWLWLWNNPNHVAMLFWCAALIAFPIDDLFGLWVDDIAALVLFCKHARDLFLLKWGKTPEQMIASKGAELIDHARDHVRPAPVPRRERLPAKWRG
jgi:hypothetical protein